MTSSNIDRALWARVQRIAYPKRAPTSHPPFPQSFNNGPKQRPASWLYHLLANDAALRAKVLP